MPKLTRRAALGRLGGRAAGHAGLIRAQTTSKPVKIGLLRDMSGPYRDVGGPGNHVATELAVEDFGGSVLGRPIEVMQADDQNKPDVAGALAREWIDDRGRRRAGRWRRSVLGPRDPAGRAREEAHLPDHRAGDRDFTGKQCSPYGFQFVYDTYALAKGTGGALTKAGGDTWFFITADYEFGYSLERDTIAAVRQGGRRQGAGQRARPARHGGFLQLPGAGAGVRRQSDRPRQRRHRPAELHQAGRRVRHDAKDGARSPRC